MNRFILILLASGLLAQAQYVTDSFTATTNEVNDGLNQTKPVTPWTLGKWTGAGSGSIAATNAALQAGIDAKLGTNAFAVNITNLSNAEWLTLQASKLADNANHNRFGWRKTLNKIASGQTVRIQTDGTGLVSLGLLNGALWGITNKIPIAGFGSYVYPYLYSDYFTGTAYRAAGQDTNWFAPYNVMLASNDYFAIITDRAWHVLELDYIAQPGGGMFKIQTNFNSGAFADTGVSVNTSNNVRVGRSVFFTNTPGQKVVTKIIQTSATGSSIVVNFAAWQTNITGGVIFGQQVNDASTAALELQVSTNVTGPIYQTLNPDMVLWESVSEPAGTSSNLTQWIQFYTNYCTNADIVLCGSYPIPEDAYIIAHNADVRSNAVNFGIGYFDGYSPFQSFTNVAVARGFAAGGSVHYTQSGYDAYGYFLSRWLALDVAQQSRISTTQLYGTFTGNAAGLTNISATNILAGATNGAVMIAGSNGKLTNADNLTLTTNTITFKNPTLGITNTTSLTTTGVTWSANGGSITLGTNGTFNINNSRNSGTATFVGNVFLQTWLAFGDIYIHKKSSKTIEMGENGGDPFLTLSCATNGTSTFPGTVTATNGFISPNATNGGIYYANDDGKLTNASGVTVSGGTNLVVTGNFTWNFTTNNNSALTNVIVGWLTNSVNSFKIPICK